MNICLVYNKGFKWYSEENIYVKGKVFNFLGKLLCAQSMCHYFKNVVDEKGFVDGLKKINGIFSVLKINEKEKEVWMATDRLRNFPLFYTIQKKMLYISDNIEELSWLTGRIEMDEEAEKCVCSFGYTIGKKTLLKDIFQLRAGEYLVYKKGEIKTGFYHPIPEVSFKEEYKVSLKKLFLEVGERMCRALENRPVALPLSGGWDSRLIGLLLKLNGYKNVFCFTYGNPHQSEALRSEQVAKRLGYEWIMIDYKPYVKENYLQSEKFLHYVDFVGAGISFPYLQEYFAARYIKEIVRLPSQTLFLPGHSGDTLAGSHFFPDMKSFSSPMEYANKNYRKNGRLCMLSRAEKQALLHSMVRHIPAERNILSHLLHDYWLTEERQAKQIVNSAKVWNYFGYEYLLPLWDEELTQFCLSLPFEQRLYKKLYNEVLEELFAENNLLLDNESASGYIRQRKKGFLKQKIKDSAGFLFTCMPKREHYDFFYFHELLEPVRKALPPQSVQEINGWLSTWYVSYFKKKFLLSKG
ncbi:MAG: asparagine synthase C-terminal domain-containing protein [Tannerellaceae bacterium]|nr:asparagine synthase C-terminal domain-containing protein [Tannerellaceae bacterium]